MFDKNKRYIYCAAAIKGETAYKDSFEKIVSIVEDYFDPATEIAKSRETLEDFGIIDTKLVHDRDIKWLRNSKALVAEMSGASSGVGSEITYAVYNQKIPCLLFHHEKADSSLYIKQWKSKYLIHQPYKNEKDLEISLRCFLNVIQFVYEEDIQDALILKKLYYECFHQSKNWKKIDPNGINSKMNKILKNSYNPKKGKTIKILKQTKFDLDSTNGIFIIKSKYIENIDFKDSKQLIYFFFKTLILQKRWAEYTKRQRLGISFLGGKKDKIIKILSRFEGLNSFIKIHRYAEDKIGYSKYAFTKNLRAFRKIGLIENPYEINGSGDTKFRTSVLVKTLSGDYRIMSTPNNRYSVRSYIILPAYFLHLKNFLEEFGDEGKKFLLELMKNISLDNIENEIMEFNINENFDSLLNNPNVRKIIKELDRQCYIFWEKEFSSFKSVKIID
jgi:hypothetical protein